MTAPAPAVEPVEGGQTTNLLADLRAGDQNGAPDQAAGARPRRRISVQTLVLILVMVASASVLYLMRRQGMQSGFKFQALPVEKELEKFHARGSADEQRILAELARSNALESLPPEQIQKNPFQLETHGVEAAPIDPNAALADRKRQEQEKRNAEIRTRLSGLTLTSVMNGRNPVAYINGRLVKVGDVMEDYFTVAQIHDRAVDLLAEGKIFTLHLSEGAPAAGQRRPRTQGPTPGFQPPVR